jgi:DNA processing protein
LGFDPLDLDSLAERSGLTIGELSAILLQLELNGMIASLPGGLYQRIT